MSYLVLARKYRSRTFEELVGQEHVVQALSNALTQGRLHHAYLFTGTRGVGKTSVSRILAKSLNCTGADGQGGVTARPCGACDACRDIDAGRFVDYIELDAASNRGVDEITLLLDQAVYKPVVGRFKVYMVDEVHMLSNHAFSAMLKTLEEPPDYLKFVLATTDPQKVPATVLSRCLQFNLRPMAPATVQEHLARVLADEAIGAEPGALRLLSRAARGSMRDALSLADQAIAFGAGALSEDGVRQMLGAVDRGHAVRIVEALAASDGVALVGAADGLRALGLSAAGTLEEIAELLQQIALAQAVPGALDDADPDSAAARRLAPLLAADETQLYYSIALHGRAELALAPDEHSGLVMLLLRMLAFRPAAVEVVAAPDGPRRSVTAAPAPQPAGGVPAPAVASAIAATTRPLAAPASAAGVGSATNAAGVAGAASAASAAGAVGAAGAAGAVGAAGAADAVGAAGAAGAAGLAGPAGAARAAGPAGPAVAAGAAGPAGGASAASAAPPPAGAQPTPLAAAAAMPAAVAATSVPVKRPSLTPPPAPASSPPGRRASVDDGLPPWLDDEPDEASSPASTARRGPSAPLELLSRPPAAAPRALSAAAPSTAPPAHTAPRTTTLAGDRWAQVVGALLATGSITALPRELAMQSQCLGVDEQAQPPVWRLRVEREVLRTPAQRDRLQAALADHLGRPVVLELTAGVADDSPALREAAERERRQREAEQLIRDDPLVRALLVQFKTARIVPGSITPVDANADGHPRSNS